MVTIPFIYFTILLLYRLVKQHWKVDIASFILLIYGSSAFFSIFVDKYGYSYYPSYKISFYATFAYCSLLTISIIPFLKFSNLSIRFIRPISNNKYLKYASICVFAYFCIYLYMSANDVYNVLTGDIGALRAEHYTDNISSGWLANMNPIYRIPFVIFNLITGAPWILQFLGFYTVIVQKMPMKYGALFIMSSLIGVVGNLSEAGRSDMVYWLIGMIACYIFYKPFIIASGGVEKKFRALGYFLIGCGIYIVGLITFSRYVDRDYGAIGGFVLYYGQSFNHFAYFFDKFECPYPTLEIIFPFTYNVIGEAQGGVVNIQQMLTDKTGIFTGLFYTYIGQISVTSNNFVAALYCFIYSAVSFSVCKKIVKGCTLKLCFLYMALASVMFLGLFSHYYGFMNKTASAIIWFFVISRFANSTKYKVVDYNYESKV